MRQKLNDLAIIALDSLVYLTSEEQNLVSIIKYHDLGLLCSVAGTGNITIVE
jgi:hypothetical protein